MQPERNDVDYLFELALKKLGPLDSDEMYAFVPALALGGSMELKNLQKVKPLSTLSFFPALTASGLGLSSSLIISVMEARSWQAST